MLRETEAAWYCVRVTGGPQGGRAISGAFFFDPAPHRPPPPAVCRVRVKILDAATGRPLDATLTEMLDIASTPRDGARHAVTGGQGVLEISGTVRLRADIPGYVPLTLSPVLDYAPLIETVTRLEEKDLLDWQTFERIRTMLSGIGLTFEMQPSTR